MEKGVLPPKRVARWRKTVEEQFLHPRLGETVSFTDYHKRGFGILASDFLCGFLHKHEVEL
jgi:hypothetical protein